MFDFIEQLILAARNRHAEKWTNVLFVVAVVVFWAVGGIIKAKSQKRRAKDNALAPGKPCTGPEPTRKVPQKPKPPPRRQISRPMPAVVTEIPEPESSRRVQQLKARAAEKFRLSATEILPERQAQEIELKLSTKPLEQFAEAPSSAAKRANLKGTAEHILSLEDPKYMRKVVLHYEIIGRPLALRPPSERIIGL